MVGPAPEGEAPPEDNKDATASTQPQQHVYIIEYEQFETFQSERSKVVFTSARESVIRACLLLAVDLCMPSALLCLFQLCHCITCTLWHSLEHTKPESSPHLAVCLTAHTDSFVDVEKEGDEILVWRLEGDTTEYKLEGATKLFVLA